MNFAKTIPLLRGSVLRRIFLLFVIASGAKQSYCQGIWTQKSNLGAPGRSVAVGFSIGNKGYIGTGWSHTTIHNFFTDFWEWDQATDVWTQKANYPGAGRDYPVGFSIGNRGYVGTGADVGFTGKKDFWEYNPVTNTWIQKANFGGTARYGAVGFSIGYKGYIGTGYDVLGVLKDFWEYDALLNTWTQKSDFGGTARDAAVGFSIGTKGYIGTGEDAGLPNTTGVNDFWEWDQATDTWIQRANFPGTVRAGATGFSIGNYGYIGIGDSVLWFDTLVLSDFWRYDPNSDSWLQMANYGGGVRVFASAFVIGCKGYVGTGMRLPTLSWQIHYNDLWEFTPPVPSASMAGINTICSGDSTTLFASGGLFFQWNTGETTNIIDVKPTVTTVYSVIVSDDCGSDTASMTVTVIPAPVASFTSKLDLCKSCADFTNTSLNGITWLWNFGDSATSSAQNNNHCYSNTGTYSATLIVYSATGMCRDTASANITFYDPDETQVVVPNVFTPNGDGINDVFKISGLDKCEPYSIKIYDRWGNLIFATEKTGLGWDGRTSTGVNSQAGVYYYSLTNNATTKKGVVTLLR